MYTFKVRTDSEVLTYTFQNTSSGKAGDDGLGVIVFLKAMKAYYKDYPEKVSVTVMNDAGLYFDVNTNRYIHTDDYRKVSIVLSDGRKDVA